MRDAAAEFHQQWLGMVQPIEGLVVSLPTLVEAQVLARLPLTARDRLAAHCHLQGDGRHAVDLEGLLFDPELLGFRDTDFDRGDDLPRDLSLWVPDARRSSRRWR